MQEALLHAVKQSPDGGHVVVLLGLQLPELVVRRLRIDNDEVLPVRELREAVVDRRPARVVVRAVEGEHQRDRLLHAARHVQQRFVRHAADREAQHPVTRLAVAGRGRAGSSSPRPR